MNYEPGKLKHYLIGDLTESESDEIGLGIISGKISEDDLRMAENELIEDYLENNLSPAELELFRKYFLISREREFQISQISFLKNYAGKYNAEKQKQTDGEDKENGFFRRFLISPGFLPLRAIFALIIVGLFVSVFSYLFIKDSANQQIAALEQKYAQINNEDFSDVAGFNEYSGISLASGSFRGAGESGRVSKRELTEKVMVRLALPIGFKPASVVRIQFVTDDRTVFTQETARMYKNPNGAEVRLLVPSAVLNPGDYQISVNDPAAENTALKYGFLVY